MLCLLFILNLNHKSLNQFDRERKNLLFFIFGHNVLFCVIFLCENQFDLPTSILFASPMKTFVRISLKINFSKLGWWFAKVSNKQKFLFIKMVQPCDRFQCFKYISFIHANIISSFFLTPNDISLSLSSSL